MAVLVALAACERAPELDDPATNQAQTARVTSPASPSTPTGRTQPLPAPAPVFPPVGTVQPVGPYLQVSVDAVTWDVSPEVATGNPYVRPGRAAFVGVTVTVGLAEWSPPTGAELPWPTSISPRSVLDIQVVQADGTEDTLQTMAAPFNGDQTGIAGLLAGDTRTFTEYLDVSSRFLGPGTVVRVSAWTGTDPVTSSWSIP
ncbi:hypothetical protein SAMN05660199_04446 [Klenkia soli]|uniref:Uncharacterized protein n=1 Tax=Klenkia soli TaxID=1052260 RepID=A0A1H0UBL1_9ACTN|nr:hypothetical protein SAMN05660199_04446 [Klenkia soli]